MGKKGFGFAKGEGGWRFDEDVDRWVAVVAELKRRFPVGKE